jgi:hypothetical protein
MSPSRQGRIFFASGCKGSGFPGGNWYNRTNGEAQQENRVHQSGSRTVIYFLGHAGPVSAGLPEYFSHSQFASGHFNGVGCGLPLSDFRFLVRPEIALEVHLLSSASDVKRYPRPVSPLLT